MMFATGMNSNMSHHSGLPNSSNMYVEVVDRNESLPEGTSHFFKGLAHKEQGDQRNYKAYHVFKNIYCYE